MNEVKLFEALLNLDIQRTEISLKNNPLRITIIPVGELPGEDLWKILKLCDKHKAILKLLGYGLIEIKLWEA